MSLVRVIKQRGRLSHAAVAALIASAAMAVAACGSSSSGSSSAKCDPNAPALKPRPIPASLDPESAVFPIEEATITSTDLGTDPQYNYKPTWYNTLRLTPDEVREICDKDLTAVYLDWDKVLYNRVIRSGAKHVMNALGIEMLRETSFDFDPNTLKADLAAVLPLNPDIIFTGGTIDPNQLATLLGPAEQKDITIVSWAVGGKGWEIGLNKPMTALVAYDFYHLGVQMAEAVAKKYPNGANLGYLHWINNIKAIELRERGFLDTIKKYPKIKVISDGGPPDPTKPNSGFKDPNAAQATTQAFLTRHPEVDVLFAPWEDPPALGMESAIRSSGRLGEVDIVTMDLGPVGAKQLKGGGTIKVDMAQDVYDGGRAMALTAAMAEIGKEPPPFTIIPTFATTNANLEDAWDIMHGPDFPCCGE